MTTSTRSDLRQALRRAAVRATLATSVHDSQPWGFVLGHDTLEVHADFGRQLRVVDPAGRQLMISCGCALLNARVSLAATGYRPWVQRQPDPAKPALVARLVLTTHAGSGGRSADDLDRQTREELSSLAALDDAIELRRGDRRPVAADEATEALFVSLERAAASEAAVLSRVRTPDDRMALAMLRRRAERQQNADPAYRAELRAWTAEQRDSEENVPALGSVTAREVHPGAPERDVGTGGDNGADGPDPASSQWLLLGTSADTTAAWVRAGEALERVLLEITGRGFSATTLTQVLGIPGIREELRRQLRLPMHPHLLLQVGRAASAPAPRRRRLVDMLSDST